MCVCAGVTDLLFSTVQKVEASIIMWTGLHVAERVGAAVCRWWATGSKHHACFYVRPQQLLCVNALTCLA